MTGNAAALDYHVVDVFTTTPYAGNPLAVVLGADDLSTAQLQALAREFNLSETAFPMAASTDAATYRLRIFTPATELPFAGHPSVGAAWVMRSLGRISDGQIVQECGAGLLPLSVTADTITLTGGPASLGEPLDAAPFLSAVGLEPGDLAGTPVRWAGCGLEFGFVHVHEEALARCEPDLVKLARLGNGGVSVFAPAGDRIRVRVFAGGVGVAEDPATGSAALGIGVFLVGSDLLPASGRSSYVVEQGVEMGRPSRLECTVVADGGKVTSATVSGAVVPIAEGRIVLPPSGGA
ncbi:MAG TPA: PhzF family phenazine biosynthesis protein [Mycobacteriales bacterium]|nr:PhzF family phenazine biosynthesis protein [Mycobacteriales bacterium]